MWHEEGEREAGWVRVKEGRREVRVEERQRTRKDDWLLREL
jgi:hypothetical protein